VSIRGAAFFEELMHSGRKRITSVRLLGSIIAPLDKKDENLI
jgi:hypothetical protein